VKTLRTRSAEGSHRYLHPAFSLIAAAVATAEARAAPGRVELRPRLPYPLPPGSFPGGETLGLPPGISVPLPGPGILFGTGLNANCEFGVCLGVPGGNGTFDPATVGAGAGGATIVIDIGLGTLCVGSGVCEAIAIGAGAAVVGAGAYIIYKKVSKRSGKEMASDAPSWASNYPKRPGEGCAAFAARILVEQYGAASKKALDRGPPAPNSVRSKKVASAEAFRIIYGFKCGSICRSTSPRS
jgi:hypothetical protein